MIYLRLPTTLLRNRDSFLLCTLGLPALPCLGCGPLLRLGFGFRLRFRLGLGLRLLLHLLGPSSPLLGLLRLGLRLLIAFLLDNRRSLATTLGPAGFLGLLCLQLRFLLVLLFDSNSSGLAPTLSLGRLLGFLRLRLRLLLTIAFLFDSGFAATFALCRLLGLLQLGLGLDLGFRFSLLLARPLDLLSRAFRLFGGVVLSRRLLAATLGGGLCRFFFGLLFKLSVTL